MATQDGVLKTLLSIARSDTSSREHVDACHRRALEMQKTIHPFAYLPARDSISEAGFEIDPLRGIAIGVKDIIATRDMPTEYGSAVYAGNRPEEDAWVVKRLREHGATVLGKTVSTEFAWRQPGPTRNPWNPAHTPGGSSSGSAAAVASGCVSAALGSQTLGSVIRPAAFCGVVGFKPSYGAIPRTGIHPLSATLDHVGIFTRNVDDAAYLLSLLAAEDESDLHGTAVEAFSISPSEGLAESAALRLAWVPTSVWPEMQEAQRALMESAIEELRRAGASIETPPLPEGFDQAWDCINVILAFEAAAIFGAIVEEFPDRTSEHLKALVATGLKLSATQYREALGTQAALKESWTVALAGFDAALTSPALGEAPLGLDYTGDARLCAPWTLLGVPALSLPAGLGPAGLPLGIQLVGRCGEDWMLARAAKWCERRFGDTVRKARVLRFG